VPTLSKAIFVFQHKVLISIYKLWSLYALIKPCTSMFVLTHNRICYLDSPESYKNN
jgi:hypothetical protein